MYFNNRDESDDDNDDDGGGGGSDNERSTCTALIVAMIVKATEIAFQLPHWIDSRLVLSLRP